MPNHVIQRLVISGPREAVERFRRVHFTFGDEQEVRENLKHWEEQLKIAEGEGHIEACHRFIKELNEQLAQIQSGEPGPYFDFASFIAPPAFIYQEGITLDQQNANRRNWYAFNTNRWGTKWNAYSCSTTEIEHRGNGESEFVLTFDTAWSMPMPIYRMIKVAWPELHIKVDFIEEGWFFWGTMVIHDRVLDSRCYESYEDNKEAARELIRLLRELRGYNDGDIDEILEESPDLGQLVGAKGLPASASPAVESAAATGAERVSA